MLILNSDASSNGLGITVRDASGNLLAAYSYQVWGENLNSNDLEIMAVVEALKLVPEPCIIYTDSKYAEFWYRDYGVKATPLNTYLRTVKESLYIPPTTYVRHVHRSDEFQRHADFLARLTGEHRWDTPTALQEYQSMYSAYQLSHGVKPRR